MPIIAPFFNQDDLKQHIPEIMKKINACFWGESDLIKLQNPDAEMPESQKLKVKQSIVMISQMLGCEFYPLAYLSRIAPAEIKKIEESLLMDVMKLAKQPGWFNISALLYTTQTGQNVQIKWLLVFCLFLYLKILLSTVKICEKHMLEFDERLSIRFDEHIKLYDELFKVHRGLSLSWFSYVGIALGVAGVILAPLLGQRWFPPIFPSEYSPRYSSASYEHLCKMFPKRFEKVDDEPMYRYTLNDIMNYASLPKRRIYNGGGEWLIPSYIKSHYVGYQLKLMNLLETQEYIGKSESYFRDLYEAMIQETEKHYLQSLSECVSIETQPKALQDSSFNKGLLLVLVMGIFIFFMGILIFKKYKTSAEVKKRPPVNPANLQYFYPYPRIKPPIPKAVVKPILKVTQPIAAADERKCGFCYDTEVELKQEGKFLVPCIVDERHPPVCNICFAEQDISCILLAQAHPGGLSEFPWGQFLMMPDKRKMARDDYISSISEKNYAEQLKCHVAGCDEGWNAMSSPEYRGVFFEMLRC